MRHNRDIFPDDTMAYDRCPPKQAGAEKEDNATAEKRKEGDSDTHRVGHGRIHGGNFYLEER